LKRVSRLSGIERKAFMPEERQESLEAWDVCAAVTGILQWQIKASIGIGIKQGFTTAQVSRVNVVARDGSRDGSEGCACLV